MARGLFRDFLSAAALGALSVFTGGLTGAAALAQFATRTAVVLGVQTYSRHQQRKAERAANASNPARMPQDNTITIRADDYPEIIVYGWARVPTLLVARYTWGPQKQYFTMVLAVPCRHKLTSINRFLFDGVDIGALDANGYTTPGSRWYTEDVQSRAVSVAGVAGSPQHYVLPHAASEIIAIDSIAVKRRIIEYGTFDAGEYATLPDTFRVLGIEEHMLAAGTHYTVAGNAITFLLDGTNAEWVITYRVRVNQKAWVRIRTNAGETAGGTFDALPGVSLAEASGGQWTGNDRLQGIPSLVLTLEYDPSGRVWATGIPQVSLIVQGAPVYDATKDSTNGGAGPHRFDVPSTWEWTNDASACLADYLRREVGATFEEISWDWFRYATAIGRSSAPRPDGTYEANFTTDGYLSTSESWASNIEKLAMSMIGNAMLIGNQWTIVPFAWTAPVLSLPITSLADADVEIVSRPGREQIINAVRGRSIDNRPTVESPHGSYLLADFPPQQIAAYVAEDLGQIYWHDVEFPLCLGPYRGQRLATFYAHRARNGLVIRATFTLDAYEVVPGERVRLPWAITGWDGTYEGGTGKVFQVLSRRYEPPYKVTLVLREDAAAIYNYNYLAAVGVDPSPNTALPRPNVVETPRISKVRSDESTFELRADGRVEPFVEWELLPPGNDDIRFEIQWKFSTETVWRTERGRMGLYVFRSWGVAPNAVLNVLFIAFNSLNVASPPLVVPAFRVSSRTPSPQHIALGNRLQSSSLQFGVGKCDAFGVDGAPQPTFTEPPDEYEIPGAPSNGWLAVTSGLTGDGPAIVARWPSVSLDGRQRIAFYAGLLGWGTDAYVAINFYGDNGVFLDGAASQAVPGVEYGSSERVPNRPAHHSFSGAFADTPEGTRYATFLAIGRGNWKADPRKALSVTKPMLAVVPASTTVMPPWTRGGTDMVTTEDTIEGLATDLYEWQSQPEGYVGFRFNHGWMAFGGAVISPMQSDPLFRGVIDDGSRCVVHVTAELDFDAAIEGPTYIELGLWATTPANTGSSFIDAREPTDSFVCAQALAGSGPNRQLVTFSLGFTARQVDQINRSVYMSFLLRYSGPPGFPSGSAPGVPFRIYAAVPKIAARIEVIKR